MSIDKLIYSCTAPTDDVKVCDIYVCEECPYYQNELMQEIRNKKLEKYNKNRKTVLKVRLSDEELKELLVLSNTMGQDRSKLIREMIHYSFINVIKTNDDKKISRYI
jgi:hypothetical protein